MRWLRMRFTVRRMMIAIAVVALLIAAGLIVRHRVEVRYARRDPVGALVADFRRNGIELVPDGRPSNWWMVTRPSAGDFRVTVALMSFPPSATERQMQDRLSAINLGFMLNAPAHVAMSFPGLRGTGPNSVKRSPEDEVTKKKMIDLFQRYRPPLPETAQRLAYTCADSRARTMPGRGTGDPVTTRTGGRGTMPGTGGDPEYGNDIRVYTCTQETRLNRNARHADRAGSSRSLWASSARQ